MASLRISPPALALRALARREQCRPQGSLPSSTAARELASSAKAALQGCRGLAGTRAARGRAARFSMSTEVESGSKSPLEADEDSVAGIAKSGILEVPAPFEEKFAVLDTGKWACKSCGYTYDQDVGDKSYPIAPGTDFRRLPSDWSCPTCGAAQKMFESKSREVAGFAQNQSYGLGGNSLTSNQKSILIYGSLLFFFILFLSGYFLQ